jgi:hypothetical protein
VIFATAPANAQEIGHRIMGTLGLRAGTQPPTGIYLFDQFLFYDSQALVDNDGHRVRVPFDLQAIANAVGVSGTYQIRRLHTFVNAGLSVPVARVVGQIDGPEGSIDRFGLADVYVQPLRLGWAVPHLDVVTGYAFYIPTRRVEPGGGSGVSRASWSHEGSLGGTAYIDRARTWQISALASYQQNQRKLGIDVTRGSTVQIQGGAGKTVFRLIDLGLVGYGLWQVTDDHGSALPPQLRGARDRVYGLGLELDVTIAEARARVLVRYTHDVLAESRPLGQVLIFGVTFFPWQAR